ncbi:MAG: DUF853 family protein [Betaproteobacteria bacterium]|nr:DUF853 family protein [Betaproteobacteria bacterium]
MSLIETLGLKESPFRKDSVFVGATKNGGKMQLEYMSFDDLRLHTSILGATGTGKTVLLTTMITQFIRNGWGVLLLDMKFDPAMFRSAWATACICGREKDFKLLSPFGVESERGVLGEYGTCSYNPLLGIDSPIAATAAILKAAAKDKAGDAYWEGVKEGIVDTLVRAFLSTGLPYSFKDLWAALESPTALGRLLNISKDPEANLILADWLSKVNHYDPRVRADHDKYVQGAKMFFRTLGTGTLGTLLNSYDSDVSLKKAYRDNQIIWAVLPSLQIDHTAKSMGKLILSELRYLAGEIQATMETRKPFLVVVDEFENFVFPGMTDLFDKGRGAGISMVIANQSPAQIDLEHSKEMRAVITANTRNKIVMATEDPDIAKFFAELTGKDDTAISFNFDGFGMREADQYLIQPRVFTEMDDFSMVLRKKGVTKRGHVVALPTDWELGVDVPRPRFEPTIFREGGVRLWEQVQGAGPAIPARSAKK